MTMRSSTSMIVGLGAIVAALALTSPAGAQEIDAPEAVPAPPPPPPPPPPPVAAPVAAAPVIVVPAPVAPPRVVRPAPLTRYSRYRTSWYIGFGLGGGGGWVSEEGEFSDSRGGVAVLPLKLGFVVRPWLLLGFEGSAWRFDGDPTWVQFNHYDAMATVFPFFDQGFYLKGGLGAGVAMLGYQGDLGAYRQTEAGFDLKVGTGYEWQLSKAFNLGLDFSYGATAYDGGNTHDTMASLTFTWY